MHTLFLQYERKVTDGSKTLSIKKQDIEIILDERDIEKLKELLLKVDEVGSNFDPLGPDRESLFGTFREEHEIVDIVEEPECPCGTKKNELLAGCMDCGTKGHLDCITVPGVGLPGMGHVCIICGKGSVV